MPPKQDKDPKSSEGLTRVRRNPENTEKEAQRVRPAVANVGNQEIALRTGRTADRDVLLASIGERLAGVKHTQTLEQLALHRQGEWKERLTRGSDVLPDPTRWHRCAQAYLTAAEEIARGQIGRGLRLFETAMAEERAARESLPTALLEHPDVSAVGGPEVPLEALDLPADALCAVIELPTTIVGDVHDILAIVETPDVIPSPRITEHAGWWESKEEEEKPEEDDPLPKKKAKKKGEQGVA